MHDAACCHGNRDVTWSEGKLGVHDTDHVQILSQCGGGDADENPFLDRTKRDSCKTNRMICLIRHRKHQAALKSAE